MGPMTTDGHRWLTINEAGDFYGVSRRTVYNWIVRGTLETRRTPGGPQRVLVDVRGWTKPALDAEARLA